MSKPTLSKPTLGVVVIAKNEERDMPGFLHNVLAWADEVVIVDDGSTDRTLDIVRSAGSKVTLVEHPMTRDGGFAAQRNIGIEAAKSDWLLHMDVDERVTPQLAKEIATVIRSERYNGYRYRRLNFFLHRPMRGGGWQYWNNPQLCRRGRHRFVNPIHEQCVVEGGAAATGQLESEMWHLNDEDYVERVAKNLRYMQMTGDQILSRGVKVRWYHLLLHPTYRALQSYLLQGGVREGTRGLLFALYTFCGTFNWWAYAWDKQNRVSRAELESELSSEWQNGPMIRN